MVLVREAWPGLLTGVGVFWVCCGLSSVMGIRYHT